jgi:AcrR family transcriptional regulator
MRFCRLAEIVSLLTKLRNTRNRLGLPGIGHSVSRRSSAVAGIPIRESVREAIVPLRERFRREVSASLATAAEEIFAEEGLRDAHVGHIAKRAGVAVGTLYNHYKDRDALLEALLRVRSDELVRTIDVAMAEVRGAPLRAQLLAFVHAHVAFVQSHRTFVKILLEGELARLEAAYPRAATVHLECHHAILERLERIFAQRVESHELRSELADAYPWLLLGMLRSLMVRDLRLVKPYAVGDAEGVVDIFLRGAMAEQ